MVKPKAAAKRSPVLAFVLNLVWLPTGYVYAGRAGLGVVMALTLLALAYTGMALSMGHPPGIYVLTGDLGVAIAGALVIIAASGLHAAWIARQNRPRLKGAAFWLAVICLPLGLGIVNLAARAYWPYPIYSVASDSGVPTLAKDDIVVAKGARASCGVANPHLGDMVIYRRQGTTSYIKRLVAGPGDRIQFKNGLIYLNGRPFPQQTQGQTTISLGGFRSKAELVREFEPNGKRYSIYLVDRTQSAENTAELQLGAGQYYLVGDNRDNSLDSRFDGPTSHGQICAVVLKVVKSPNPSHVGAVP